MRSKPGRAKWLGFILVSGALVTGCQKAIDHIHHNGKGDDEFRTCRIRQITLTDPPGTGGYTVHYNFTYNKLGDPVSVINDLVCTGNPNLVFKYDKYNRLREFIRPYTNGSYETWEKYGYNARNQIVRDTMYGLGVYVSYGDIQYDAQDRVIGEHDSIFMVATNAFLYTSSRSYSYDANGNLEYPPGVSVSYDNKLNIHRTNKIWMFIARDYSVNNPFIATQYTPYGLPVTFRTRYESLGIMAPYSGNAQVEYWCADNLFTL